MNSPEPGFLHSLLRAPCSVNLCVPEISSTSRDQAIFVDRATDASAFSNAVLVEVITAGEVHRRGLDGGRSHVHHLIVRHCA